MGFGLSLAKFAKSQKCFHESHVSTRIFYSSLAFFASLREIIPCRFAGFAEVQLFSASLKDDYKGVQKNLDVGGEGYVFDV